MSEFRRTYADEHGRFFGRIDTTDGTVVVLHESGERATRLACPGVYPVGSNLGARNEHPEGIIITRADADKIGLRLDD
jgi:hypothetical protein